MLLRSLLSSRWRRKAGAAPLHARIATIIFNQMFSAPHNAFDALRAMQEKKIVLINTDRYFLGDEASAVFGRFFIAQCLAAALARAPDSSRVRLFLIAYGHGLPDYAPVRRAFM